MNSTGQRLIFLGLVALLVSAAWALDYQWFTDREVDPWGFTMRFQTGDIFFGPVRSNDQIAMMGQPEFYDLVITTADDFWRGTGYAPIFHGPDPIFHAPALALPTLDLLYSEANRQGNLYEPGPRRSMMMQLLGEGANLYEWTTGTPVDSSNVNYVAFAEGLNAFYFDCPLRIYGRLTGQLAVGSTGDIRLENDLTYADADVNGVVPDDSPNLMSIAAEGDIKIANSPANGRENCNGGGRNNPNQDFCGIILSGAFYALRGSFTFENQNDADSGYVCSCNPDERGYIHLFGGVVQERRGFVHRSSQGGSGYLKDLRWDSRLRDFDDRIWETADPRPELPDTIDFGAAIARQAISQTLGIRTNLYYGGTATYPFMAHQYIMRGDSVFVPLEFTPPRVGNFSGTLTLYISTRTYYIPLLGEGVEDSSGAPGIVAEDAPAR